MWSISILPNQNQQPQQCHTATTTPSNFLSHRSEEAPTPTSERGPQNRAGSLCGYQVSSHLFGQLPRDFLWLGWLSWFERILLAGKSDDFTINQVVFFPEIQPILPSAALTCLVGKHIKTSCRNSKGDDFPGTSSGLSRNISYGDGSKPITIWLGE